MTSKTNEEEIVKNSKNLLGEKGASEGLTDLISKINELHKTGGMETLFELISLLHAMRSAASDKLVERTLQAAGRTTDVLMDEKTLSLVEDVRDSIRFASMSEGGNPLGFLSSLKLLAKPEARQTISFMIRFACELEKRTNARR